MHCCINFQLKASPNSFGVEHFTPVVEILICNAVARYNYLVIITVVEARIACWQERQTCDQKVVSSNPSRSGRRFFLLQS